MATPRLARLELTGADGGPLYLDVRSGARAGEVRPAVVICHGFKGFKDWGFFPVLADRLALAGFTAVTFNFSGSGVGPGGDVVDQPERWFAQRISGDLADLDTVIGHLSGSGARWIGLIGHSRGGGVAVVGAAGDRRVTALVTWAAVATFQRYTPEERERWRREGRTEVVNARTGQVLPIGLPLLDDLEQDGGALDILAAAGRLAIPWLIAHGRSDESVPAHEAEILARASASPRTELLLVEGAGHTFGARHPWAGSTPVLEQVLARTTRFLGEALA